MLANGRRFRFDSHWEAPESEVLLSVMAGDARVHGGAARKGPRGRHSSSSWVQPWRSFNPRSPRPQGATVSDATQRVLGVVSTHAPLGLGERPNFTSPPFSIFRPFQPTLQPIQREIVFLFQPTLPSASGSDALHALSGGTDADVSTHAPLALNRSLHLGEVVSTHAPLGLGERRAAQALAVHWLSCFNPRSPRPRGATRSTPSWRLSRSFQPTLPSASGSDAVDVDACELGDVSTHAPLGLGERRGTGSARQLPGVVSTHAPLGLGERHTMTRRFARLRSCFNPRSPRPRGATTLLMSFAQSMAVFQPTLPSASGSDTTARPRRVRGLHSFNPRSPRPRGATHE